MIEVNKLRLMPNYVLIKTKEDYNTYQINGRETGILNSFTTGTAGQRMSVFGTVMVTCDELAFRGQQMQAAKRNYGNDAQKEVERLKKGSVWYDVPMELKPGDEVMYFYKNQLDCYKDGRVFHTDEGVMMLMRYDQLRAVVKAEDELYPLNGRIFIQHLELKSDKQTAAGIHLLEKSHMDKKIKKKTAFGRVLEVGCFCDGYLEFPDKPKDHRGSEFELKPGDYIMYDSRMANNLEYETHQTLKTARTILHRKDVYMRIDDVSKFEFAD